VENEYGAYGDVQASPADRAYMEHLVRSARAALYLMVDRARDVS